MSPQSSRARRRYLVLPLLVFGSLLACAGPAAAATQRTWSGAGGNALWSNPNNWVGNAVPAAGDGVTFTAPTTSTDDIAAAISNVVFTSAAGGSKLGGTLNINSSLTTINIESDSDGNRIEAAIVNTNSNLFIKSSTAGQTLTLTGVISGANGIRIYGPGTVEYAEVVNNTYGGLTVVASNDGNGSAGVLQLNSQSAGALVPGDLLIGGTATGQPANSARVELLTRDDISNASAVTIASDGLLDLNGLNETVGSAVVTGNITQGSGTLTVAGGLSLGGGSIASTNSAPLVLTSVGSITATGSAVVTSPIRVNTLANFTLPINVSSGDDLALSGITTAGSSTISMTKAGAGVLELSGASTYTGNTSVTAGALSLNAGASLASAGVSVSGGGTLQGLGSSGPVAVADGAFAPEIPAGAIGAYTVSGELGLSAASAFDVGISNPDSGGYDAVSATGPVALGNSALHLTVAPGFTAPPHSKLRIIDNLGSTPVNGTFQGLPEGAAVALGTQLFKLTYVGGTGNDVELDLPNAAPLLAAGASVTPSPGTAGKALTFSAAAADADNDALTYTWSFGDGSTGTGATTTHTYSAPGQYAVSVSISDGFGGSVSSATTVTVNQATAGPTPVVTLTQLAQTHTKWRAGKALAVFAKSTKRAPLGTQFSFTLSEAASVALAFTQSASGRKSGGRCVAQTTKNRKAKSCKRTLALGTIAHAGHSGRNTASFQGRVASAKTLKPGRYTVTVTATNAAGQQSKPSSLSFTVVK